MPITLRPATPADIPVLEQWDRDPDVLRAITDDAEPERVLESYDDWADELAADSEVMYHLIAELDGRPIGALQICDPHREPTHYWGDIEPDLRAIDIWIGSPADRNQGHGAEIMRQAHALCFADPSVRAIVIDPLATNTRAIAFYRRLGYRDVGRRHFGPDDCLVLRLDRPT